MHSLLCSYPMRLKPFSVFLITIGVFCALGAALLIVLWLACPNGQCPGNVNTQPAPTPSPVAVNNFSDCAAAGYPVMESYPQQCKTPDGQTFIEDIGNAAELTEMIYADSPKPNAVVQSPLMVTGAARGNWYFEASFPVKLLDANGNVLVQTPAQAQGEWMTTEFVPFSVKLAFETPTTTTGTLVLQKDNPSGLPEYDNALYIPIRFR